MNKLLKYAGSKSWLKDYIDIPEYNTYYEPFFGSGAFFFYLKPKNAVINDMNTQLIGTYNYIKNNSELVKKLLLEIQDEYNNSEDKKSYYYKIRNNYNQCILDGTFNAYDAANFIFLNKCGFNGLYRVNKNGFFNVPWGKKSKINLIPDNYDEIVECLKTATIFNTDFEAVVSTTKSGDLILLDPPYDETFTEYQKTGFTENDQQRVAKLFKELSDKGCYCILTNSNTDFIKSLYSTYNIKEVEVRHSINRNGNDRIATEVIVTNF